MTMYVFFENGQLVDDAFKSKSDLIQYILNEYRYSEDIDDEDYQDYFTELMNTNEAYVKGCWRVKIKEVTLH